MSDIERSELEALAEALDPCHQGEGWPDPIAWDGRPLREQAVDLLIMADAELGATPPGCDPDPGLVQAAACLRQAMRAAGSEQET